MLDLDDYEHEYLSKQEQKIRGPQAVYSANLMGLSNLKPLEYILFEHNVFCKLIYFNLPFTNNPSYCLFVLITLCTGYI